MANGPISYSEAAAAVSHYKASETEAETLSLLQAAGRILAREIRADRDQPPFPRSTRDGFACRAAEANSRHFLRIAGRLRAGDDPDSLGPLAAGEVHEIMTGAAVPAGADAVFMVEHAETAAGPEADTVPGSLYDPDATVVRLAAGRTVSIGDNIVPLGAEARAGDLLVSPGVLIGPAHIALAAQCGYAELIVFARPRIAILSTGDELVPIEAVPGPNQIRNSNSSMLAALVTQAGGQPSMLPSVGDEEALLRGALEKALTANLLLITGGISAGRFDLVEEVLVGLGARLFFRGVAIQPGKPIAFGEVPRRNAPPLPFFALPGNPISSAVTFRLFAAPLIAALAGKPLGQPQFSLASLQDGWQGKPGLTRFLPAVCDFQIKPVVRLTPWQGSGDLAAFARSNCLVAIAGNLEQIPAGALVPILIL